MEEIYLKDIIHECHKNERVCDWNFIHVNNNIRVYYKPYEKIGLGFNFYAVENTGGICNNEFSENEWNPDYCFVNCLFHGIALFDGIRHLYMGDELTNNFGYQYYPSYETTIKTLKIIQELEKKYCNYL